MAKMVSKAMLSLVDFEVQKKNFLLRNLRILYSLKCRKTYFPWNVI